jgi:hypothetical protein
MPLPPARPTRKVRSPHLSRIHSRPLKTLLDTESRFPARASIPFNSCWSSQKEQENLKLRQELNACQEQLSMLHSMVKQLKDDMDRTKGSAATVAAPSTTTMTTASSKKSSKNANCVSRSHSSSSEKRLVPQEVEISDEEEEDVTDDDEEEEEEEEDSDEECQMVHYLHHIESHSYQVTNRISLTELRVMMTFHIFGSESSLEQYPSPRVHNALH